MAYSIYSGTTTANNTMPFYTSNNITYSYSPVISYSPPPDNVIPVEIPSFPRKRSDLRAELLNRL